MVKRVILGLIALGILTACTQSKSASEMWDQARQLSEKNNYDQAMEIYKQILAKKNAPDSILAKTQFTMADLYLNHYKRYQKSLEHYREVAQTYGSSKWGPKSQFMIGYTYANYIHDYDKAKKEYQTFLDVYPTSELTEAVKFEMKYMGKDLQDINNLDFMQTKNNTPGNTQN